MTRRAFRQALTIALLGAGVSGPAAAQDAGVESVFATGAGNRALSLGGAYAAIANDASAPVWNPAGLALLSRTELQATSATLYGIDISEQYASFALPSWRWGTAAFGFRRFAVGGIEQRDDRNVLLSDDLGDSQTEFKLSFARPLGDGWSGGGSVKIHRQSLAGFDDFGVGLDLGVMARPATLLGRQGTWLDRVQLGLSVRNIVEPTLRLDEEAVPDPTGMRAGFAWRQPIRLGGLGPGHVLTSFDIVKTRGVGAAPAAGLEVVPHPLLALRFGYGDNGLTAGTGVQWRLYSLDYALEDTPIDAVHRFGVTMRFGPTQEARRAEARRKEEEAFRQTLAETFEARQRERVAELLEQARGHLTAEAWDDALNAAATVAALEPGHPEVAEIEAAALLAKAEREESGGQLADASLLFARVVALDPENRRAVDGLERCRRESDLRAARTARIREMFTAALDAFTGGDLVTARDTFRAILNVAPDDDEARGMLERTKTAIRGRTGDLVKQGNRYVERGLLDEAEGAVARTRDLDPYARGLAELASRIRKERTLRAERERALLAEASRRSPETGATIVPKGPALSSKKRKEIADLYERGRAAVEEDRADDALRYWELVWLADPNYLNVADYLKREYLLRGLESFSRGGLDEAVSLWEKALKVDPSDEKALGYLQRAREQQNRSREILGGGSAQ